MNTLDTAVDCGRYVEVIAVVVAYKPRSDQLIGLLKSLSAQCGTIFVMDNGGAAAVRLADPEWPDCAECIEMFGNSGLGAALNRGFALARERRARYVISFDQDSAPRVGTVHALLAAHKALTAKGLPVGAVGPRFIDERYGRQSEFPFMRLDRGWPRAIRSSGGAEFVEADFLITSGCLVSIATFDAVGEFDTGMFVDYTDVEWGFRATSMGFKLYGAWSVLMRHELGLGRSATILGLTILGYSPVRRYYYARNTVRLIRLSHVPWPWKARMLLGLVGRWVLLPALARWRASEKGEWTMYIKGIWAGMRGVRGGISGYDEPRHPR